MPTLYGREPWRDDPYDALISFAFVAVPLLVGLLAVRVRLCPRPEPLPARRVVDLLRLCRLLVAAVLVTAGAEWASVLANAGRSPVSGTAAVLIALLSGFSAVAAWLAWRLYLVSAAARARGRVPPSPDCLNWSD